MGSDKDVCGDLMDCQHNDHHDTENVDVTKYSGTCWANSFQGVKDSSQAQVNLEKAFFNVLHIFDIVWTRSASSDCLYYHALKKFGEQFDYVYKTPGLLPKEKKE